MSRHRQSEVRRALGRRFDEAGGTAALATPAELGAGIVHYLQAAAPRQAAVLTAAWWPGWTPETLAGLLEAGRVSIIVAHYHAPAPGRTGAAAAAQALGLSPACAGRTLQRGQTALGAWLAARAAQVNVRK